MNADTKLNFGRYNGRTVESIWTGVNNFNEIEVIEKYLFQLCSFLLDVNNIYEIPCSRYELSQSARELLFFSQSYIEKIIEIKGNEISVTSINENISTALFNVLKDALTKTESFIIIPQYYTKNPVRKNIGHSVNSINFQFLQADPQYINWCIKNRDSFFFNPTDLEILTSKNCRYLSHFKLNRTAGNRFVYKPIFKELAFELNIDTISTNEKKYTLITNNTENMHNVAFNDSDIDDSIQFCAACHEMPCICSDREQSSSIYDF